jgi:predicted nucleic acid-binding protein
VKSLVIDTSVAVKWFSQEKETDIALRLRDALAAGEIRALAPDLLVVELANALRHNPHFRAEDVVAAVASVFDLGLEFVPPNPALLERAVERAFRHRLTVYDGFFIALADATTSPLLTADEKLLKKTKSNGPLVPLALFEQI